MPIVEDSACRQVYGSSVIADSMICTARSSFDVGPCAKDLGSPLFTRDPLEMVGFYSWDWGCDVIDLPPVYTQVSYYIDWIDSVINI